MKNKKVIRNITVIISIVVVLIDIGMYMKLNNLFDTLSSVENPLERAGGIIGISFYWGTFIWGIISLAIIWSQYFLIILTIKFFNQVKGIKKWLLCSLLGFIILYLFFAIIRILEFMVIILFS